METRAIAHIALFAAIVAVLGLLPRIDLPVAGGVPITAQTLGVMLAGVILGARRAGLALLLFLFVVALGAPFLAGGRGGLGAFAAPSAGFLVGWLPGAFVCGLIAERLAGRLPVFAAAMVASIVGGILVIYAFGIPVLAWKANLTLLQAAIGSAAFLPGDLLKAVLAGLVATGLRRAAPSTFAGAR
ncbi:MAG: biotin transporter BioY [Alphaproteobacteria bacterium]